jgi:hypothetical protein
MKKIRFFEDVLVPTTIWNNGRDCYSIHWRVRFQVDLCHRGGRRCYHHLKWRSGVNSRGLVQINVEPEWYSDSSSCPRMTSETKISPNFSIRSLTELCESMVEACFFSGIGARWCWKHGRRRRPRNRSWRCQLARRRGWAWLWQVSLSSLVDLRWDPLLGAPTISV